VINDGFQIDVEALSPDDRQVLRRGQKLELRKIRPRKSTLGKKNAYRLQRVHYFINRDFENVRVETLSEKADKFDSTGANFEFKWLQLWTFTLRKREVHGEDQF